MMKPLHTLGDLDAAIAGSSGRPALVFKHSTTCGTSAYAHEEVESLLEEPGLRADVYIVALRAPRPLNTGITGRTRLTHQ